MTEGIPKESESMTEYHNAVSVRGVFSPTAMTVDELQWLQHFEEPSPVVEEMVSKVESYAQHWTEGAQAEVELMYKTIRQHIAKRRMECIEMTSNTDGALAALRCFEAMF
jgi:protease II